MSSLSYSVKINAGKYTIVDIERFDLSANKITFLFGESGIGKSMISKAIYGLLDPELLDIKLNNQDYETYLQTELVGQIQSSGFFVFQEPSSHLNPLINLKSQLNEGSLAHNSAKDEQAILRYLWNSNNGSFPDQLLDVYPKPYRPSGGEKQRFLLVMAFKKIKQYLDETVDRRTAIFIFDEPSGSLDNVYRNLFLSLLLECYRQKPFTCLLITHDYSIISELETNHQDLQTALEYMELSRGETGLQLTHFSKDEYLGWVRKQTYQISEAVHAGYELLRVANGIKVFGRTLRFNHKQKDGPSTDLILRRGELVYLKAQSGVGKTTIAKIIMGLVNPDKVSITFDRLACNEKTKEEFWHKHIWGKKATMIFQHADEALNLNATVLETFAALGRNGKVDRMKVLRRLQEMFYVRLSPDFLKKKVRYLSGGQKQRINILRSLVLDTDILIMDEPLNGLDLRSSHKVIDKIQQRQAEGKGILLISHNEDIFDRIAHPDNVFYLRAEE